MKKILQVVGALGQGGDTVAIMNMAKYIDPTEFQMEFLSHKSMINKSFTNDYCNKGGIIHLIDSDVRKMGFIKYYFAAYNLIKKGQYDVVHVHTSFQSIVVLLAAYNAGVKKRVCHSHTAMVQRPVKNIIYKCIFNAFLPLIRYAIRILSTDCVACGYEAGMFLFGKNNFKVLHNGIDLNRFNPQHNGINDALSEYDLDGKVIIGQIGSIKKMKNQEFTIQICSGLTVDYEMFFIGTGSQKCELEEMAKDNHHIHFLGSRSDIPDLLRKFDVLILPSLPGEGLPVTAIEAQACGCPCLMSEYITHEADLGIGLVKYISLTNIDEWRSMIRKKKPMEINISEAVSEKGFDIVKSSINWIEIYRK